ncbi:hypothetical protein N9K77_01840 [bacterium]|nr:hypothetical protein [bacterium]
MEIMVRDFVVTTENKDVRMGALASKIQVERVKENVELLMESQEKVFDNSSNLNLKDASRKLDSIKMLSLQEVLFFLLNSQMT